MKWYEALSTNTSLRRSHIMNATRCGNCRDCKSGNNLNISLTQHLVDMKLYIFGIDLIWNNIKVVQDVVDGMVLNKRVRFDFQHAGVSNETGSILMRECSVGDELCKINNDNNNNNNNSNSGSGSNITESTSLMIKVNILTIDQLLKEYLKEIKMNIVDILLIDTEGKMAPIYIYIYINMLTTCIFTACIKTLCMFSKSIYYVYLLKETILLFYKEPSTLSATN